MQLTAVDMFGVAPGRGSALDVLVAHDGNADDLARAAAGHASRSTAVETALVPAFSAVGRTFTSRVFNACGETPFGTHSLAGTAAALVHGGHLPAGGLTRLDGATGQPLWTDGYEVRVPFTGPVADGIPDINPTLLAPYGGTARACGVGRAFTFVRVEDDPLCLPAPSPERMRAGGFTDLTLFHLDAQRRRVRARVFAPGFGIAEDAGCLPVAASLAVVFLLEIGVSPEPVEIQQVTSSAAESIFTCTADARDGSADVVVTGRVWAHSDHDRAGSP